MKLVAVVAMSVFWASGPAQAQWLDGNSLHTWCQSEAKVSVPYVLGVLDGIDLAGQAGGVVKVCTPSNATREQVNDVVCRFVEDHPADRHYPASLLVLTAMANAFPCAS